MKKVVTSRTGRSVQNVSKGEKPAAKSQPSPKATPRGVGGVGPAQGPGVRATVAARPTKLQGVLSEGVKNTRSYAKAEIASRAATPVRPPLSTAGVSRVGGAPKPAGLALRGVAAGAARGASRAGAVGAIVGAVAGLAGAAVKSGANPNPRGRSGTKHSPVAYQSPIPKPTFVGVTGSVASAPSVKASGPSSRSPSPTRKAFNAAFAQARQSGARGFSFRGKQYNTKVK